MTARPRMLFVSPRFLLPMDEGGKIRSGKILSHLKGGCFETVLVSPAPRDLSPFRDGLAALADTFIPWHPRPVSRSLRALSLGSRLPVSVASDRSESGRAAVMNAVARYAPDIAIADFPHAAVLMPDNPGCPSMMFTHNVEAEIYERHAAMAQGWRASIWRNQASKMRRFESSALQRFDGVIAVSDRDAEALRNRYHLPCIRTISTGIDLDFFQVQPAPDRSRPKTVVFVGVLDSPANVDAVTYLMDEIWPLIARGRPDARAVIVGRNPPARLVAEAKARNLAWNFTGFVEDVRPFIAESDISVIPMRVGSGTRIKAYEALAMGRPVVSTSVGVEGLHIVPGEHFLAADTPESFARETIRLMEDDGLRAALAAAGRAHLEQHFPWSRVARQFETICLEVLGKAGGGNADIAGRHRGHAAGALAEAVTVASA